MDLLDREACYRALKSRDPRFDGRLFVGVTSTGIYCRPVCPARTPKPTNCRFFASAAAAQEAGFRPCLRCRPETAPGLGSWRGTSNTVARALQLIAEGALDASAGERTRRGEDSGVEALAARVGVGGRQLRRLFERHLGASPIAVAQTRRVLFAKHLLHETRLPMAEIALAAGFGSVRRFNETFRTLFRRPPSALRRKSAADVTTSSTGTMAADGVTLRLRYRPPYDWPAMLAHLAARAVEGVEEVAGNVYRRTVAIDGALGTVEIGHEPARRSLVVLVRFPSVRALPAILARTRRVFDVDADVETICAHLSRDPLLARIIEQRPGLRPPGGWDGFEQAVRGVLGQQVSVIAARQLAGKLVAVCGEALPPSSGAAQPLTRAFPTPARIVAAAEAGGLDAIGMPASRHKAIVALARAAIEDPKLLEPFGAVSVEEAIARLRAIHGVGEWTAQYIALRALREPDAFPAGDVALLRAVEAGDGLEARPTPAELLERAEAWRPWRAYAAQHLWTWDAARSATSDDVQRTAIRARKPVPSSRSALVAAARRSGMKDAKRVGSP